MCGPLSNCLHFDFIHQNGNSSGSCDGCRELVSYLGQIVCEKLNLGGHFLKASLLITDVSPLGCKQTLKTFWNCCINIQNIKHKYLKHIHYRGETICHMQEQRNTNTGAVQSQATMQVKDTKSAGKIRLQNTDKGQLMYKQCRVGRAEFVIQEHSKSQ